MNLVFRVRADLLAFVRRDLERPHPFAAERVGFFTCRAGHLMDHGLLVLAGGYDPVADDDYLRDPRVGAMMGPAAIRKALQRAYNNGQEDIGMFHVHMHDCRGYPGFSSTDLTESAKFVPDFYNVAPRMPHGTVVLSRDRAAGLCWLKQTEKFIEISRFSSVGGPLQIWKWTHEYSVRKPELPRS
jgi:hypothetical protein